MTFSLRSRFIIGCLASARHSPCSLNLLTNETARRREGKNGGIRGEQAQWTTLPFFTSKRAKKSDCSATSKPPVRLPAGLQLALKDLARRGTQPIAPSRQRSASLTAAQD